MGREWQHSEFAFTFPNLCTDPREEAIGSRSTLSNLEQAIIINAVRWHTNTIERLYTMWVQLSGQSSAWSFLAETRNLNERNPYVRIPGGRIEYPRRSCSTFGLGAFRISQVRILPVGQLVDDFLSGLPRLRAKPGVKDSRMK